MTDPNSNRTAARPGRRRPARKGATIVLSCVLILVLLTMVAFAVDTGYLLNAKTELHRSADAAAMAAAWEYLETLATTEDEMQAALDARAAALEYAELNGVCKNGPLVDANLYNSETGDVVVGYLSDLTDSTEELDTSDPSRFNAVRVRVQRTATRNGEVPTFFARFMGIQSQAVEATATAAFNTNIRGFRIIHSGTNAGILPIALDLETWEAMNNGGGDDDWSWDPVEKQVVPGWDGRREMNLYPIGNGSPGNRGTVDIGGQDNSTSVIDRQIRHGVTKEDLDHHNGELVFDDYGEMQLNADTGISTSLKAALEEIKGQPRMIPIFSEVVENGNTGTYTIVKWVGIRIVDVKMTGNNKRVIIQSAPVVDRNVIPSTESGYSVDIYTPVVLTQ